MTACLVLAAVLTTSAPNPNAAEALGEFDTGNYSEAALLLDELARSQPDQYRANNLHYLRGRIAGDQQDWVRAEREFNLVGADNVLYDLAVWHLARIAILAGHPDEARARIGWLPSDFPPDLMMELARIAGESLRGEIYDRLSIREARVERARLRNDRESLWTLVRENQNDDDAVRAAEQLFDLEAAPPDRMFLARVYAAHRSFERAEALYVSLLEDPEHAGEAHFELGRVYFQLTRYDDALGLYRAAVLMFPDTEWADRAYAQIAPTYWRQLDFDAARAAYLELIEAAGNDRNLYHDGLRDLVDVFRALGDTASAREWIARGLDNRPSTAQRGVLLFTRGKIEYLEGDYEAALDSFRQVAGMSLRDVPDGTDLEEMRFFESLTLEKLGRMDEATELWRDLARARFTYYGIKASEKLGASLATGDRLSEIVRRTFETDPALLCRRPSGEAIAALVRARRLAETRAWIVDEGESSRVGELTFLHLWDEAFYWTRREAARYEDRILADLAFLAGEYRQAMLYADRLRPRDLDQLFETGSGDPEAAVLRAMLFPAAFEEVVCRESAGASSNPLWLRSIMWQESRYDPNARSGAVARGLMQFIPETARDVGLQLGMVEIDLTRSLYEPEVSIRLGAHYWAFLMDEFPQPEMALAAYNGGPHNVMRWHAKSRSADPEVFVSDIGFVETKAYVRRVFELYARYAYLQSEDPLRMAPPPD
jgi:tetratricopeptide (TPR) repeat protein